MSKDLKFSFSLFIKQDYLDYKIQHSSLDFMGDDKIDR